jgi:hypothetical protein
LPPEDEEDDDAPINPNPVSADPDASTLVPASDADEPVEPVRRGTYDARSYVPPKTNLGVIDGRR